MHYNQFIDAASFNALFSSLFTLLPFLFLSGQLPGTIPFRKDIMEELCKS